MYKKIIFGPIFLIFLGLLCYLIRPVLVNPYESLFNFSFERLIQLILIVGTIILSALFFVIWAILASDYRYLAGLLAISAIEIYFLAPSPINFVLIIGLALSMLAVFPMILEKLKSYLTFEPLLLFTPFVKNFISLLILTVSLAYYFNLNSIIQTKGFEIPDSLIETSLNLMPEEAVESQSGQKLPFNLSLDQIEYLKKNPNLVKQFGFDPKILETIGLKKPAEASKDLLRSTIENAIKPFSGYIPMILALLFFLTLHTFAGILSLFIFPLLWLIFYLMEKTNFITFTKEMREVKKLVV